MRLEGHDQSDDRVQLAATLMQLPFKRGQYKVGGEKKYTWAVSEHMLSFEFQPVFSIFFRISSPTETGSRLLH